ncbi:uncharacterized protein LOC103942063 isoform X3 [Pyrus x bretschneideri]|uniref:uncharacterized protein LOC103942063 isoform X3 n=1 Tax=Pyrus x bretschneideri TaxID=225117 RepID=UPI0020303BD6|nr:uncharacterized protein LOC103942063 isoform X3 [Pyrus x bretschneideri]XP_048442074.1 uncharacterized protein LOC103942063 isoform X3 [Pyrus x bretschneideri]
MEIAFRGWFLAVSPLQRPVRYSIVCEVTTKKPDSAVKRAWQAEKRRIYNQSRKSEIKTRMKKLLTGNHTQETLQFMNKECTTSVNFLNFHCVSNALDHHLLLHSTSWSKLLLS